MICDLTLSIFSPNKMLCRKNICHNKTRIFINKHNKDLIVMKQTIKKRES
jgi:hypothetical protein